MYSNKIVCTLLIFRVEFKGSLLLVFMFAILGCGFAQFNCQSPSGSECQASSDLCDGLTNCLSGFDEDNIFCSGSEFANWAISAPEYTSFFLQ